MDDRRGHGGEHDGAEEAEAVDRVVRSGGRQQVIDPRKEDEDERHDDGCGERLKRPGAQLKCGTCFD